MSADQVPSSLSVISMVSASSRLGRAGATRPARRQAVSGHCGTGPETERDREAVRARQLGGQRGELAPTERRPCMPNAALMSQMFGRAVREVAVVVVLDQDLDVGRRDVGRPLEGRVERAVGQLDALDRPYCWMKQLAQDPTWRRRR
jgi:hypothetical protein